jgi:hypothetical protein
MDDRIAYHPPFLEAAVRAALDGDPREPDHHREREAVYALASPEARDRAFGRLAAEWFRRLELDRPFRQAIQEVAAALAPVRGILIGPAVRDHESGADLLVPPDGPPTVVIRLRPDRCARRDPLLTCLRRELLHIADMLDPAFRYEPRLPPQPAGPAHDRLVQERYRLLWDCSVDGRLQRSGLLPEATRPEKRREFLAAFPIADAEGAFGAIYDGARPTHSAMVALATRAGAGPTAHRCALCAFPFGAAGDAVASPGLIDPAGLSPAVAATIGSDFPGWNRVDPVCIQCADLYDARAAAILEDRP